MSSSITLPLWLALLIGALAAWALLDRLLMPSVRWLVRNRDTGFSLFRRGKAEAIVDLSLDQNAWGVRFSDDGNLVAAGHPDGSVSVHNLSEIQKRLATVGLGWKL